MGASNYKDRTNWDNNSQYVYNFNQHNNFVQKTKGVNFIVQAGKQNSKL